MIGTRILSLSTLYRFRHLFSLKKFTKFCLRGPSLDNSLGPRSKVEQHIYLLGMTGTLSLFHVVRDLERFVPEQSRKAYTGK